MSFYDDMEVTAAQESLSLMFFLRATRDCTKRCDVLHLD